LKSRVSDRGKQGSRHRWLAGLWGGTSVNWTNPAWGPLTSAALVTTPRSIRAGREDGFAVAVPGLDGIGAQHTVVPSGAGGIPCARGRWPARPSRRAIKVRVIHGLRCGGEGQKQSGYVPHVAGEAISTRARRRDPNIRLIFVATCGILPGDTLQSRAKSHATAAEGAEDQACPTAC
jgi:hypothetical protein